jgi:hypothetical protein
MTSNDAAFARAQAEYDAMEPPEPKFTAETRVLHVSVWLTYDDSDAQDEDETIEAVQTPSQAEQAVQRVLMRHLAERPAKVEATDATYMSERESEDYGWGS